MAQNPSPSHLDEREIFQRAFQEADDTIRVSGAGIGGATVVTGTGPNGDVPVLVENSLVPARYNEIVMTYVPSGNGVGQIATAVYKLGGTTVATLTMTYNSSNQLTDVVKT
jgi:hypothetical protein